MCVCGPCRFQIDRRKYHPAPAVHGAVVDFELLPPHERPAVPSERAFLQLVGGVVWRYTQTVLQGVTPLSLAVFYGWVTLCGYPPRARLMDQRFPKPQERAQIVAAQLLN